MIGSHIKINIKSINDFIFNKLNRRRVLALHLWRYGLQDVKGIIYKKLIK
jgi:hypothetical protein